MTNKLGMVPNWDLTDFYKSIADKNIAKDINDCAKNAKSFAKKHQGKVAKLKASDLLKAIIKYEEISQKMGKISSYSYLVYACDLSNQKNIAFYQDVSEKLTDPSSDLVFFTLEINEMPEGEVKKLLKSSKDLQKYAPFIRDIRSYRKHQLSHDLEKYSLEKDVTARDAWVRLFDETVNNLEFSYRKKTLSSQEIFDLMTSKDQKVRKDAASSISKTLKDNSKTFAYITNVLAKNKSTSDKWRGFKKPISSRNLNNCVEDEVVDVLIKKVKENYKNISHKYYKKKAKILGQKHLNHYDRNAPLSTAKEDLIPFKEAKNLVLDAYEEFSPKMREIGEIFFDKNWIDAKVKKGKDSGAFSHPVTPCVHPYIMMNYQGKIRDVMTLAHELGHGVHQYLAAQQGYFMSQTPLTLAETASVFGEQLVFQKILKNEKNAAKKQLIIANKVEDMINTAVRQIAFLEFERQIHDQRQKGEIPLQKICDIWMSVQTESLGSAFKFDKEEYQYSWSYIPHFIHSPFYVYAYAFGDCLVNSLYGVYKSGKVKNFTDKYIEMLTLGGVHHHKEMLAPFKLDAKKPQFWQSGLDVIASYVDQIEC